MTIKTISQSLYLRGNCVLKSLYLTKIKGFCLALIPLILIGMIPQSTSWGLEKDTKVPSQTVEGVVYGRMKNNGAKVTDIYEKGEWDFTVYGDKNFTKDLEGIRLVNIMDSNNTIIINKSDFTISNERELTVKIKGSNAEKFSQEKYAGNYNLELKYKGEEIWIPIIGRYNSKNITITGQDFKKDIKQIVLKNIKNGAWEIVIPKQRVKYENDTKLTLTLEDKDVEKLSGGLNNSDIEVVIDYTSDCVFDKDLRYWDYTLIGENLRQGVEKIILRPISGRALSLPIEEQDIIIEKRDIRVVSNTRLNMEFRKDVLDKFREYNHSGDYKIIVVYSPGKGLREFTSGVDLKVLYNYGLRFNEKVTLKDKLQYNYKDYIEDTARFSLLSKSTPKVTDVYPKSNGGYPWIDEGELPHNALKDRSFLKATFEDIDGKLEFNSPVGIEFLLSSSIKAIGSNIEYLDTEFLNMCRNDLANPNDDDYTYIFKKDRTKKEAYLYIPIKPLSPQTDYIVRIAGRVLRNDAVEEERYSSPITWEFTTMASPSVTDKEILNQTVIEDYSSDTYIKIYGDFFYTSSIRVFFNEKEADYIIIKKDNKGNTYLVVYLPRRLGSGLYNIIIQNDNNHSTITYGTLSVLPRGDRDNIPTEEYKVKNRDLKGDVLADIKVSTDTLYLSGRYTNRTIVELDLDELMGKEVWTRRINYKTYMGDYIGKLYTKSKYADVSFYNLGGNNSEVNLYIGRAEPRVVQGVKTKLGQRIVKSDFIEIRAQNCRWNTIDVSIPYKNSNGANLNIYRYDEIRRTWNKEISYIDYINQKVTCTTQKAGLFVILEN